jgi:hypothetical protein
LGLEEIIKSNKELYEEKIDITRTDIKKVFKYKKLLEDFGIFKVQKLDPHKLLLLTQKGHLDLFEKDIFEYIEKYLS